MAHNGGSVFEKSLRDRSESIWWGLTFKPMSSVRNVCGHSIGLRMEEQFTYNSRIMWFGIRKPECELQCKHTAWKLNKFWIDCYLSAEWTSMKQKQMPPQLHDDRNHYWLSIQFLILLCVLLPQCYKFVKSVWSRICCYVFRSVIQFNENFN